MIPMCVKRCFFLTWMACLTLIFCETLSAQTNPADAYTKKWSTIDSLLNQKGLYRDALREVKALYAKASIANQEAHQVKALIYRLSIEDLIKEDSDTLAIEAINKSLKTAKGPVAAILHTLLADYYQQYYSRHRWEISSRTALRKPGNTDLRTWPAAAFQSAIREQYAAALQHESLLQSTSLTAYEPILNSGNARKLRPTLYDLLAWKAMEFYQQDDIDITRAATAFRLIQPELFSPASEFTKLNFSAPDAQDPKYQAIRLYQSIITFHVADKDPEALIDADLSRLQFAKQKGNIPNQLHLYRASLERIRQTYPGTAGADEAAYRLASTYSEQDAPDYATAVKICKEVTAFNRHSGGYAKCYNLLQETMAPSLALTTEKVNLPAQAFRALVSWKNFSGLQLRLILLDDKTKSQIFGKKEAFDAAAWKQAVMAKPIRSWQQALPEMGDYQEHRAEIKVDGLPVGEYLLLGSNSAQFSLEESYLAAVRFHVSGISFINRNQEYFLLHRETGEPLAGAAVQLWYKQYDYQNRKPELLKGNTYSTNSKGYLKISDLKEARNIRLDIRYKEDHLFLDEEEYIYVRTPVKPADTDPAIVRARQSRVYFFTDRSIYRPGQTLYFKGIAITKEAAAKPSEIYTHQKGLVVLYNANGEKTDSITVTTNRFGSYAGEFHLPATGLTGSFRLEDQLLHGDQYIQVEAYKRPKFEVSLEMPKGTYRLNDSIEIHGLAKAYAGNAINGAKLHYRVTRITRRWQPWRGVGKIVPAGGNQQVAEGDLITSAAGSFQFSFLALPDDAIKKSDNAVFDFEVAVDVTDQNGETRSAVNVVPVSYKALQVQISLPGAWQALDSFRQVKVSTANLNGLFEKASVTVSISPLLDPGRLIRSRLWPAPDTFTLAENDYIRWFPHDEYREESDPRNWKTGTVLWSKSAESSADGVMPLDLKGAGTGWYRIIASSVDRYGDTVKDEAMIWLYDHKARQWPTSSYIAAIQDRSALQPGESSAILLASGAGKIRLIQERQTASSAEAAEPADSSESFNIISLDQTIYRQNITASEANRGGFGITHFFVKDNRFFQVTNAFAVPWTNKTLHITVGTYRDKTMPGSRETWTVGIRGEDGGKSAAELLTSLYDASLDQFQPHQWNPPYIWPTHQQRDSWSSAAFSTAGAETRAIETKRLEVPYDVYDELMTVQGQEAQWRNSAGAPGMPMLLGQTEKLMSAKIETTYTSEGNMQTVKKSLTGSVQTIQSQPAPPAPTTPGIITPRQDFRETAFFFPQLLVDTAGNYTFSFTMPEAVTSWKWQLLAHDQNLAMGYAQKTIVTQKELMVQPNMPRFLREGDHLELTTKIVNLSDTEMTGLAELQLLDATNNQPVDGWFNNFFPNQYFTVAAHSSELVKFPVEVPYLFDKALTWRIVARSGERSDGEQATLPVLTNRQLITEALPFYLQGNSKKEIAFTHLLESAGSETLSNQSLTIEFTANPAWYAVQALPYLSDYPYDCAEQAFNRLYANLLAGTVVQRLPKIKAMLEQWQQDSSALFSNLQQNSELKQVLLEETPWVLQAKSETEQKKQLTRLFNFVQLAAQRERMVQQLIDLQTPNGGFSWFKDGPDDRFITQYIISGIGHLQQLGAIPKELSQLSQIVDKALPYLDACIKEDYDRRDKQQSTSAALNYYAVQYAYMRSFFPDRKIPSSVKPAANYYLHNIKANWLKGNRMAKAMIALALYRNGEKAAATGIVRSLEQSAIRSAELGMYWKDNRGGYYWQDAPIETQALLIEAFHTIKGNPTLTAALKTWLIRNKQTNHWGTTKATADACYALLLQGDNWLKTNPNVRIALGDAVTLNPEQSQAGTGYYQKKIPGTGVFPEMGKITIQVQGSTATAAPVWGAVYWQYFENLDKIKTQASPLRVTRQVMVERPGNNGPVLEPVVEGQALAVGDKIVMRLEISTDRAMEYVHLKDTRASSLEPVNVLSGYRWQGSLGYYESTRDASSNFFIGYLPRGSNVLEYACRVTHTGVFINGISTLQCMYAPEFTSHSGSMKITVE